MKNTKTNEYTQRNDLKKEEQRRDKRTQWIKPVKDRATLPSAPVFLISFLTAILALFVIAVPGLPRGQTQSIPLDSTDGLKLINVKADPVTFKGRKGLRVTDTAPAGTGDEGRLAVLSKIEFQDGVIEVDLAGEPARNAPEGARGFVGIAFRIAADESRFECIYLRPTNGRVEDQVRRNHSVQYISIPGFPWQRLRKEFPEKYESYVDLVPGEWTKVKIEVRGDKANLYVHGAQQPTLVINDLKQGQSKGAIALWVGVGTVAHFSNLRIQR